MSTENSAPAAGTEIYLRYSDWSLHPVAVYPPHLVIRGKSSLDDMFETAVSVPHEPNTWRAALSFKDQQSAIRLVSTGAIVDHAFNANGVISCSEISLIEPKRFDGHLKLFDTRELKWRVENDGKSVEVPHDFVHGCKNGDALSVLTLDLGPEGLQFTAGTRFDAPVIVGKEDLLIQPTAFKTGKSFHISAFNKISPTSALLTARIADGEKKDEQVAFILSQLHMEHLKRAAEEILKKNTIVKEAIAQSPAVVVRQPQVMPVFKTQREAREYLENLRNGPALEAAKQRQNEQKREQKKARKAGLQSLAAPSVPTDFRFPDMLLKIAGAENTRITVTEPSSRKELRVYRIDSVNVAPAIV